MGPITPGAVSFRVWVATRASAWMPVAPLVLVARGRQTQSVGMASRAGGRVTEGGRTWAAVRVYLGIGVWTDGELRRLRLGVAPVADANPPGALSGWAWAASLRAAVST
jgi:hypothetical protein